MAMSPRQRSKVSRGVQYGVLVVLFIAIAFTADWSTLREQFFNGDILPELFPTIFTTALKNTLLYTSCAFAFGLVLGLILALMRLSSVGPYRWISTTFVEFFRGVPALIVFIGFYYGLPVAFPGRVLPGGTLGVVTVALGLVGAAYMAETIRAGIQAVPKGQMEAARSLGMSIPQAMRHIILPQAFKRTLPPMAGQFISLVKDSSLVSVIAITDLTKSGREVITSSFATFEVWLTIAALYLVVTSLMSQLVFWMERRLAISDD